MDHLIVSLLQLEKHQNNFFYLASELHYTTWLLFLTLFHITLSLSTSPLSVFCVPPTQTGSHEHTYSPSVGNMSCLCMLAMASAETDTRVLSCFNLYCTGVLSLSFHSTGHTWKKDTALTLKEQSMSHMYPARNRVKKQAFYETAQNVSLFWIITNSPNNIKYSMLLWSLKKTTGIY